MTRSRFYFVAAAFSAAGWLALSPPEQIVFDFSADARTGVAVFDPVIAAWRGMDQSKSAPDLTLGREDLVFRLTRADGQACREMEHGIKF